MADPKPVQLFRSNKCFLGENDTAQELLVWLEKHPAKYEKILEQATSTFCLSVDMVDYCETLPDDTPLPRPSNDQLDVTPFSENLSQHLYKHERTLGNL